MGKIISRRLKTADDPMFSGGLETFSIRRSRKSTPTSPADTVGEPLDSLISSSEESTGSPQPSSSSSTPVPEDQ